MFLRGITTAQMKAPKYGIITVKQATGTGLTGDKEMHLVPMKTTGMYNSR